MSGELTDSVPALDWSDWHTLSISCKLQAFSPWFLQLVFLHILPYIQTNQIPRLYFFFLFFFSSIDFSQANHIGLSWYQSIGIWYAQFMILDAQPGYSMWLNEVLGRGRGSKLLIIINITYQESSCENILCFSLTCSRSKHLSTVTRPRFSKIFNSRP